MYAFHTYIKPYKFYQNASNLRGNQIIIICMQKLNYTEEQYNKAVESRYENPTIERMCLVGCGLEELHVVSLF